MINAQKEYEKHEEQLKKMELKLEELPQKITDVEYKYS
jgi:phage shock protein A